MRGSLFCASLSCYIECCKFTVPLVFIVAVPCEFGVYAALVGVAECAESAHFIVWGIMANPGKSWVEHLYPVLSQSKPFSVFVIAWVLAYLDGTQINTCTNYSFQPPMALLCEWAQIRDVCGCFEAAVDMWSVRVKVWHPTFSLFWVRFMYIHHTILTMIRCVHGGNWSQRSFNRLAFCTVISFDVDGACVSRQEKPVGSYWTSWKKTKTTMCSFTCRPIGRFHVTNISLLH